MADLVSIVATSRYLYVSRADGSLVSRHLFIEDAIESAVNAGPGAYDIVYPSRRVVVSKVYGTLPASPAPTAPTALTLEEATGGYVSLSWTDDGNGTSWTVYRDGAPIGTASSSAYTDSTVVPSMAYSYQVQASNSSGSSTLSDALAVTTSANSLPTWSLTDQSGTIGSSFALNLNSVCDDADSHTLSYSLTSGSVPGLSLVSPNYSGTPTTAGAYPLTFQASDGYGTADVSITFTVADPDVTAPTVPTSVSASANGSTVTVTWTASTDASGVANYRIYRDGQFRATDTASPYVESGVPIGTYSYTVSAVDSSANANESAQSSAAPVTVVPGTPDVPINFTATAASSTQINLSWAAGPNGAAPDDYDLDFSASSSSGPWTSIPLSGTATTYSHTGLTTGATYYYRVRAGLGALESGYAATSQLVTAMNAVPYLNHSGGPLWLHGYGQIGTSANYNAWKTWMGHEPDVAVCWSTPATNWTGFRSGKADIGANFTAALAYLPVTTLIVHAYPMFGKYNNTGAIGTTTGTNLSNANNARPATWAEIANGTYDAHYTAMATAMRTLIVNSGRDINTYGGNVVLRLGWEMNGDWYDHSIMNSIADFKASWARIVGLIRAVIPTMRFDFSPARPWVGYTAGGNYVNPTGLSGFIPDEQYVDYITRSTHDVHTNVPGYGTVSTVDNYTFNYKHGASTGSPNTVPSSESYRRQLDLTELATVGQAMGKRYGISEWAAQMGTAQTGELLQSQQPHIFVEQVYNWLYTHRNNICWDAYLSSSNEALYSRTTTQAAIRHKSLWNTGA